MDTIADMLTRIRNANRVGRAHVNIKRSGVCLGIARVLRDEGYIVDFSEIAEGPQGSIRIVMKYGDRGEKVIQDLQRDSRPGCRRYVGADGLPRVMDGLGIAVVSTSKGVLSDRTAREQKVGGEVLCEVW